MFESVPAVEAADPWILTPEESRALLRGAPWKRLVAIGDSAAQGITEPAPGYRTLSWYGRVLESLAASHRDVAHLNLGERGLLAAEVRATQMEAALAFEPDLAVVLSGGNDLYRRVFDIDSVEYEWSAMFSALLSRNCTVVTSGMFDITLSGMVDQKYRRATQERITEISDRSLELSNRLGVLHVDLLRHPAGAEAIYCNDGLHLNARGQAILATEIVRALGRDLRGADRPDQDF